MKALVHKPTRRVVQIEDKEFPVSPSLEWIPFNPPQRVVVGSIYSGGEFTAPAPKAAPVPAESDPLADLVARVEALEGEVAALKRG